MSVLLDPSAAAGESKDRENVNEKGAQLPYTAPPDGRYKEFRANEVPE